jgi:signal transduction histidine kinase/CheY-like chemotaxis protein
MINMATFNLAGSRAVRLLIPSTVVLIILLGWLVEQGERLGFLNGSNEAIILVVLLIFIYSPLIYLYARRINKADERIIAANRLYATLSQVNQTIVHAKDREVLYRSICNVAVRFGEFSLAWIGLLDEDTGEVRPVAAKGLDITQWPFPIVNIRQDAFKNSLIAAAIRTADVVTSEDIQIDRRVNTLDEQFERFAYRAIAAIPFQLRGKTIGVLCLYSPDADLFKAEEEVRLLKELGWDISFALDTIETEAERLQTGKKLEKQNQRLKVLREIDTAILAADSVENIVVAALSHIRELIGCRRANLTLIDAEKAELAIFEESTEGETSIPRGRRLPIAQFEDVLQILSQNQPVLFSDLQSLPDPIPGIQSLLQEGLRSTCTLPLFTQGSLVGMFSMHSETPGFFDDEKISLGREVANQVAIALSQNKLFEDLRLLNAELEQRIAERTADLSRTNIELEHANHAKDEFLATMSHELRTPLNSILGLSESLLEQRRDPLTEYQQQSLQIVESSGRHLLHMINDILDLSKIDAGKLDYYPQVVEVDILCRSSLAFVKVQALRKSIVLVYQVDERVPKIHADPRRMKQMLVNLLANAVKFTEHGRVELQVRADPEQDLVQFSVIDTGIGINKEDMAQLFQPFIQVDSRLNRQFDGTGLGLYLVQKLADLHGGSVEVESEVGRGSRFTINLPWGKTTIAQQAAVEAGGEIPTNETTDESTSPEAEPTENKIVLLAEDNTANILTISEYLKDHGYEVLIAHDGFEVINMAEQASPHIILMDIQMPAMDGLEAIRRLRANPRFAQMPIIALTALAMPGDRERCLEAGANEYMSKPVNLKMLVKTIDDLLRIEKE